MYKANVYNKSTEGNKYITKNFCVKEFACEDGSNIIVISQELVELLQKVRNYFGKAVTITSGYRTVAHNKKVGGSADSQHLYGIAADIIVKDTKAKKVANYIETLLPSSGGIGIYTSQNFVHVDLRPVKTRWNG